MINIKKVDADKQIVFGEVYAPVTLPDADGDIMSAETIENMAYNFMKSYAQGSIDIEHDYTTIGAVVVESFIAREDDPLFIAGSWVVGVHIEDDEVWESVKSGELNGFSLAGEATSVTKTIEVEIPEYLEGMTSEDAGHSHRFVVNFNEDGKFIGGITLGGDHTHVISRGTVTEVTDDHTHKFSYIEILEND